MINIHYIQPFSIKKNIGKAYNEACALIPENDWICITDYDVLFLRHDSKKQIYDVVAKYGDSFDLFGCITNRLRKTHQLYENKFSNEVNILYHKKIADKLHNEKYGIVSEINLEIAGFFMLFNQKTWQEFKFKEKNLTFDTLFSLKLLKNNKKIGIIEGLYVFHSYRIDKIDPINSTKHLKL